MRTSRRGLTVIELVIILLVVALIAFFLLRMGGGDEAPVVPAADSAAVPLVEPGAGNELTARLGLLAPLDSTAAPGDTLAIRVRATAVADAAVPGATVTFEVTAGGGQVEPTTAVTNDIGEAAARWVLGAEPGRQTVRASVRGDTAAAVTAAVTAVASAPER